MDVIKLLNELEDYVETRRHIMDIYLDFHRDDFLDIAQRIRAALPEDVKKGARLSAEKDRVLDNAKQTADQAVGGRSGGGAADHARRSRVG